MVYILESKLLENKSIYFALNSIYGIGKNKAFLICKKLGFAPNFKVKNLSSNKINQIFKLVESLNYVLANDLRKFKLMRKQHLLNIKSYRGLRRKKGFPVRGQRTHTNARTSKKLR
eukprot:Sro884_mit_g215880.1 rps13 (116) ;mRNA; f:34490-34837